MAGVVLEGVSRVFSGGVAAVDRIDLEVKDQEFLVLVGPSGCGKSTTLRLIAGLEDLTSGQVRIAGRLVNDVPPKDRNIAMVFQNYALYPHMTVYKNMAFALELRYGGSWLLRAWRRLVRPRAAAEMARLRTSIGDSVRQAARILGIEHLLSRRPGELSGGERQRVALGRAIVRQPSVFLFDEPLSNLDAQLRVEMRRELKQLHTRLAATMIYVTHDQVEALTLGDRVAVLDRGAIQQVGTPLEIYDAPANRFVAGFIGTPPMNFAEGTWVHAGGSRSAFAGPGWTVPVNEAVLPPPATAPTALAASRVVLGVRPEDVWLTLDDKQSTAPAGAGSAKPFLAGPVAGRVTLIEPMGDSATAHVEVPSPVEPVTSLRCKVNSHSGLRPGNRVRAWFDMNRVHWFEPATGRALMRSPERVLTAARMVASAAATTRKEELDTSESARL